jgi:hypothetical protein
MTEGEEIPKTNPAKVKKLGFNPASLSVIYKLPWRRRLV